MGPYGFLWVIKSPFASFWVLKGSHKSVCVLMFPYGSL